MAVLALLLRFLSIAPDVDELDCKPLAVIVVQDDDDGVTDYTLTECVQW